MYAYHNRINGRYHRDHGIHFILYLVFEYETLHLKITIINIIIVYYDTNIYCILPIAIIYVHTPTDYKNYQIMFVHKYNFNLNTYHNLSVSYSMHMYGGPCVCTFAIGIHSMCACICLFICLLDRVKATCIVYFLYFISLFLSLLQFLFDFCFILFVVADFSVCFVLFCVIFIHFARQSYSK